MTTTAIVFACISICFFVYGVIRFITTLTQAIVLRTNHNITEAYTYIVLGAIGFFLCLVL